MPSFINSYGEIKSVYAYINDEKKKIKTIYIKNNNYRKVFSVPKNLYEGITWADGTDAEIIAMLDAHYAGEINIHDYWHVGDERVVHIAGHVGVGLDAANPAQDVVMVLMNVGGRELVEPINGVTECAFIVGQKDCLSVKGRIHNYSTNKALWQNSMRRTWCNTTYYNAIPESIRPIFKMHINKTSQAKVSNSLYVTNDYFSIASQHEVLNITTDANASESENAMFEYYATASHRKKYLGIARSKSVSYWTRSPSTRNSSNMNHINNSGTGRDQTDWTSPYGIAPFGVI